MEKIFFVLDRVATGGLETYVYNAATAMDRKKYDITFVLSRGDSYTPFPFEVILKKRAYRMIDIGWVGESPGARAKYFIKLLKLLKREKPDIVYSNNDFTGGIVMLAGLLSGVKKRVCHVHTSSNILLSSYKLSFVKSIVYGAYYRAMFFCMRYLSTERLGCSEASNKFFYAKRKSIVINNGIVVDKFRNPQKYFDECENRLETVPGKINFVAVGSMRREKNPLFTVEIIKCLSKLRQDFCLNWFGEGKQFDEVNAKIREYGIEKYINMFGFQQGIFQVLNKNDFFLMPSLFEGLPLSILEAQAAGLDCFVSDVITPLVNVGKCNYLPLDKGAEYWAEFINDYINSNQHGTVDEEKLMKFDVSYTVKQLDEVFLASDD